MILALIQARMGSTRLPGKVLADIGGHPMVWHVVNRLKQAPSLDQIMVATSKESHDDELADFCQKNNIPCSRGKELDVLDRFYQAAKQFKADVICRITADCPLIDPQVVERVVSIFLKGDYDYVSNVLHYTYPDGLDIEVFSFKALEASWQEVSSQAEREHVTLYFRTSGKFRLANVENDDYPIDQYMRWTVDEPSDLAFVRAIYARLGEGEKVFGLPDILQLLAQAPEIKEINKGIICNEGYYKSLAKEPPVPSQNRVLKNSLRIKIRAEKIIPTCSQTFSKAPTQFVQNVAPVFLSRGQGSHVWDVDGNEYIDYPMALGPIILGHNYPVVTEAVIGQIQLGTTFSLPHPLEVEVAEKLIEIIPCAEMIRFGKNGSDVTSGAVRVARAYTGREIIACCGYHGWQDWYIGTTTRNLGVPRALQKLTLPFEYNQIKSLEYIFDQHPGQVAAVIMEPIGVVEPLEGFLQEVQELTRREGALLIFDEVVTGFRLAMGGAQEYFGLIPDLACFGKAIGNGYPIATVVGRKEIMKYFDEIFFSFTFGGETVSLAAAQSTISEMLSKKVIRHLWEQGTKLKDGYNVLAREFGMDLFTQCLGLPPRTVITFKDDSEAESLLYKSLFQQECLKRGVLFSGGQNICYSHTNADIDYTLRVYRTAMEILKEAIDGDEVAKRLEGPSVQAVFRRP
jgi:glutamate-1-semialdehyde-2,1-aminomutase